MNEYLIKQETIKATADAIRENLPIAAYEIIPEVAEGSADGLLVENSVTVYYREFIDEHQEPGADNGYLSNDTMVAYDYLPNNEGVITPVIYDTDLDNFGQIPDTDEPFFYVGTATIDGQIYDKWRKIEPSQEEGKASAGIYTWDAEAKQYIYTNVIVHSVVKPSSQKIDPVDFPSKVHEVYKAGKTAGGGDLLKQIIDRSITEIDLTKFGNITTIGAYTFCQCTNLTSVVLPCVDVIGENAFYNCTNLQAVFFHGTPQEWEQVTIGSGNEQLTNAISFYSEEDMSEDGASYWHYVDGVPTLWLSQVSKGLTYKALSDGTYSLSGIGTCSDAHVIIPKTYKGNAVKQIAHHAFLNCTNVTNITIPDSIIILDGNTFTGSGITDIQIPDSVTKLGNAFSGCTNLRTAKLSNNITNIPEHCFSGCTNLISITMPSSVTTIGNAAFMNCTSLASFNVPDTITSIGNSAFTGCKSLEEVTFGAESTCTYIGSYAFSDCVSLVNIRIPHDANTLGSSAFRGCTSLTHVRLPYYLLELQYGTFYECTNLISVEIYPNTSTIVSEAFFGCTSFAKIYYLGLHNIWSQIRNIGGYNEAFTNATVYYYSSTAPTVDKDTAFEANGNWWYSDGGIIHEWKFNVKIDMEKFNNFPVALMPLDEMSFTVKPCQTSIKGSIKAANSNNRPLTLSANVKYVNSTDAVNYTFERTSALGDSVHYYELTLSNLIDDVNVTISGNNISIM